MPQTFVQAEATLANGVGNIATLYTAPGATKVLVIFSNVTNKDTAGTTDYAATLIHTDAANVKITDLAVNVTVPTKAVVRNIIGKVLLNGGEKIRGYASAATAVDIQMTVLEGM